ncbi:uncharacterized protein [Clytia hemisphaerica]|uniref:uncharacterized protein n=1 Tax=Clytia hemisphaerica TaxID=252671 RepID=UPI0034D7A349
MDSTVSDIINNYMDENRLGKVEGFLTQLGLSHLIPKFQAEKFDEIAILHSDDSTLKEFGVTATGDIIRLRLMCRNGDMNDRRAELKGIITNGSKTRNENPSSTKSKNGKPKTRQIHISWKVFDKKQQRFIQIRRKRGGGCAKISFLVTAEKDTVLTEAINHFWSTKKKGVADGKREDYFFHLENETEEPISDLLTLSDNSKVPFTVGNYINKMKHPRPKVYLVTKSKSNQQRVLSHFGHNIMEVSSDSGSDDSDSDLSKSRGSFSTSTPSSSTTTVRRAYSPVFNESLGENQTQHEQNQTEMSVEPNIHGNSHSEIPIEQTSRRHGPTEIPGE